MDKSNPNAALASMPTSMFILGRQPALGLAELESLYGDAGLRPAGDQAALLDRDPQTVDFQRLGGSIKLGKLLTTVDNPQWPSVEAYLRRNIADILKNTPEGKIKIGLSLYGFPASAVNTAKLNATGLTLKKILKGSGRSVRVVPNKELELNSAQVLHNQLTSATGCELLVVRDGQQVHIARTTAIQDIDAYAARDQGRPKRDARVGMLPPKLAQTIVNLAVGNQPASEGTIVLDPFCGTGVVLQEATLMGFDVYGSDLEPRMVEYTTKNLTWLNERHQRPYYNPILEAGDATTHTWNPIPHVIAAETYLGQPFSTMPTPEKLEQVRSACNTIHRKFLKNIGNQLQPGDRLCLAVPAWQTSPGQFQHLPILKSASGGGLDHLEELGYNRMSFKHVSNSDLVYARADQIVARELLVLTKV